MKRGIRGSVSAVTAAAAAAMAGCATLFLSFWLLGVLIALILPRALEAQGSDAHGWPWWTRILSVGSLVCAAAVARYVWGRLYQGRASNRSSREAIGVKQVSSHRPAGAGGTAGRDASSGIGVALRWAFFSTLLAFSAMFFTPLIIGGPGGSLTPVFAIVLTPIIFVITLVLTLARPRLGIITVIASLLFPVWYYIKTPQLLPEGKLRPLNTEERALIKSRRFQLRVAVDAGRYPPVYRESLLKDLGETGLFTEVGPIENSRSPDLIATVTGQYYGDTTGDSFSLHWARQPERKVNVKLWYYVRLSLDTLRGRTRRLELERLALEVVRQMDALGPPPSVATGNR
jgi:hypothetical protein